MSNYNPHGLAVTVSQRAAEARDTAATLTDLAARLEPDRTGTYDDYWAQHAEEHLLWRAEALESTAASLRYLAGRYTLTGMHRVEAEERGEAS